MAQCSAGVCASASLLARAARHDVLLVGGAGGGPGADADAKLVEGFAFFSALEPDRARRGEGGTEACRAFARGACTRGAACPYSHVPGGLGGFPGERTVVCKHWLRGLCKKGDMCEFLHEYDLSRMPECYFYSRFGECSNPECVYLHINPEDKIKECAWYARGFCKHGTQCRGRHVKKTACANYLRGFCPEGTECAFGHPKYELPKDDGDAAGAGRRARMPIICHRCGVAGHKVASCPENRERAGGAPAADRPPLDRVTCFKCGLLGHYANKCPGRRVPGGGPDSLDRDDRDDRNRDRDRGGFHESERAPAFGSREREWNDRPREWDDRARGFARRQ